MTATPDPRLPWTSDHPVDAALVARLVDAAFPALAPSQGAPLDEGWDFDAWLVNGTYVVRFPKRAATAGGLAFDRRVLPFLASRVGVPVPRPELYASGGAGFPFPFGGYRLLPGAPLDADEATPSGRRAVAHTLARLVADLRRIPVAEARAAGIVDERPLLADAFREQGARRFDAVAPALPAAWRDRVRAALDEPLEPAPEPPVVCHGDLREGHVLVDPTRAVVTGVIDWTDTHLGDPARDVAGLVAAFGPGATRAALAAAGLAEPPARFARSRRRAVHVALAVAWWGLVAGRPREFATGLGGLTRSVEE